MVRSELGGHVRATVQNLKRAGTKIFFIGVRTRTYGDCPKRGTEAVAEGDAIHFFRHDSCETKPRDSSR